MSLYPGCPGFVRIAMHVLMKLPFIDGSKSAQWNSVMSSPVDSQYHLEEFASFMAPVQNQRAW